MVLKNGSIPINTGKTKPTQAKKTVGQYINRPKFELYDMQKDPHESNNLAADPAFAKLLDQYQKKIKAYQKKFNDPWITKWDYE